MAAALQDATPSHRQNDGSISASPEETPSFLCLLRCSIRFMQVAVRGQHSGWDPSANSVRTAPYQLGARLETEHATSRLPTASAIETQRAGGGTLGNPTAAIFLHFRLPDGAKQWNPCFLQRLLQSKYREGCRLLLPLAHGGARVCRDSAGHNRAWAVGLTVSARR